MTRKNIFTVLLLFMAFFSLNAQARDQIDVVEILRGEVFVDLEPIYRGHIDPQYPLDIPSASRRALQEAALFYSAMIYGWSFHFEIGERARNIEENIELTPIGIIEFGDTGLRVTYVEVRDSRLFMWTDYHMTESQQRRLRDWRTANIRNAQGIGYDPSSTELSESPLVQNSGAEPPHWIEVRQATLEDAARAAIRAMLRGSERNRPKEVTGFISLASFPRYYIESGRWAVSARFRVQIKEVFPFAAH